MSILKFYKYNGQVLIPTIAPTESGLLVEVEPVICCSVDDRAELEKTILDSLHDSTWAPPEDQLQDQPEHPVILAVLGLRRWADFERKALLFTLHKSANGSTLHITGRGSDGFWSRDDSLSLLFPPDCSDEVLAERIASYIAARAAQPQVRLLGLAPPATPDPRADDSDSTS